MNAINGYNIDLALSLLGPKDLGDGALQNLLDSIIYLVETVAKTILRLINLMVGDHLWYSNETARNIVEYYYAHYAQNYNHDPQKTRALASKVRTLFEMLKSRSQGFCSSTSWAKGFDIQCAERERLRGRSYSGSIYNLKEDEKPSCQENKTNEEKLLRRAFFTLSQEEKEEENLFNFLPLVFKRGQIANKTLIDFAKSLKKIEGLKQSDIETILLQEEKRLYSIKLVFSKEPTFKRKYIPDPKEQEISIAGLPSEYKCIKDPFILLKMGLQKACSEIYGKASFLAEETFLKSNKMVFIARLCVYDLIEQAFLEIDACSGPYLKITDYINARYKLPMVSYIPKVGGRFEIKYFFDQDLFTSFEVGADPEGVKRLLHKKNSQEKEQFRKELKFYDKKEDLLFELIDDIAKNIIKEYLPSLFSLFVNEEEKRVDKGSLNASFRQYIQKAKTPYELIEKACFYAAQEFADLSIIGKKDYASPILENAYKKLIFHTAIFYLLQYAPENASQSDFAIRFNDFVQIRLGFFLIFEKKQNVYVSSKRFIPHLFGGVGSIEDIASDPIAAYKNMQKLKASELVLLKKYIQAPFLLTLYKEKKIEAFQAIDELQKVGDEVEKLEEERKKLLKDTAYQIINMSSYAIDHYYVSIIQDLVKEVTFKKGKEATPLHYNQEAIEEKIQREIYFDYLKGSIFSQIIIKDQKIRDTPLPLEYRVSLSEFYTLGSLKALQKQNIIYKNRPSCGNCFYAALAMAIFGPSLEFKEELDHYSFILRKAVFSFMTASENRERFYEYMIYEKENFKKEKGESDPTFHSRVHSILSSRLDTYCQKIIQKNNPAWATGLEMEVLSLIFAIPIEIYYIDKPLSIGLKGTIDEGVILPNSIIGKKFDSFPARLVYDGIHYGFMELKTIVK